MWVFDTRHFLYPQCYAGSIIIMVSLDSFTVEARGFFFKVSLTMDMQYLSFWLLAAHFRNLDSTAVSASLYWTICPSGFCWWYPIAPCSFIGATSIYGRQASTAKHYLARVVAVQWVSPCSAPSSMARCYTSLESVAYTFPSNFFDPFPLYFIQSIVIVGRLATCRLEITFEVHVAVLNCSLQALARCLLPRLSTRLRRTCTYVRTSRRLQAAGMCRGKSRHLYPSSLAPGFADFWNAGGFRALLECVLLEMNTALCNASIGSVVLGDSQAQNFPLIQAQNFPLLPYHAL